MDNATKHSSITPELEKTLLSCSNLPSLPAIALQVLEASKNPNISLHEVAEIISADPAISVKLLKIANSPLYSQNRSVTNLRQALTLLGFNASLTIALSFSLLQTLSANKKSNNNTFWARSILSATIARMLGERMKVAALEDLFLSALLQDIGVLLIDCIQSSPYDNGKDDLKHDDRVKLEKQFLGLEHCDIGAWFLSSWGLSENLVNAVKFSHSLNAGFSNDDEEKFHYCLHLSGSLADVWLDNNPGELLLSILQVASKVLNLSTEEFNELVINIDKALPEVKELFNISITSEQHREKIIAEAKELLLERSLFSIKQSEDDREHIEKINDKVDEIKQSNQLDHLTGAYNRQYIDKLLDIEFYESRDNNWPMSVAYIDIDDFKLVNDSFGHSVGDEVLKLIANFFLLNIRKTDVLARYGGDEFILMLPGVNSKIAKSMIERLLQLYDNVSEINANGEKFKTTLTIGLATNMDKYNFNTLKELLKAADQAVYNAKDKGKNCLAVYSSNM